MAISFQVNGLTGSRCGWSEQKLDYNDALPFTYMDCVHNGSGY